MDDPEKDIRIFFIEENISLNSMQKFSSVSSILNYVQRLRVIASENEEELNFSISNVVVGV